MQDKALAAKYGVDEFPTILSVHSEKMRKYDGEIKLEAIVQWLEQVGEGGCGLVCATRPNAWMHELYRCGLLTFSLCCQLWFWGEGYLYRHEQYDEKYHEQILMDMTTTRRAGKLSKKFKRCILAFATSCCAQGRGIVA